jgi:iron complex outermembrane receptor protein
VNVITSPLAIAPGVHLETGYGAFTDGDIGQPTRTYRAAFATGLIAEGKAALSARYSRQDAEGYRRSSGTDIETTGLAALYVSGRMRHKIDLHAGRELTHFAWDGIPLADLDDRDARRDNVYAAYSNNVDDFQQVVGSVSSEVDLGDGGIVLSNTLYLVDGEGFFEQFETDESLADYGVSPADTTVTDTDLVRRRWLVNGYWGILPQARIPLGRGTATLGLGFRRYASDHFGELVWTEDAVDAAPLQRYYLNQTEKTSFEAYGRVELPLAARTQVSAALQYQGHRYRFDQASIGNFRGYEYEADHDFISPRVGVRQGITDELSVFASAAYAQREPSANDYMDEDDPFAVPAFEGADDKVKGLDDPIVDPETVIDLEIGAELRRERWSVGLNLYQIEYRDQLIPLDGGRIEEEGRLRRANADHTRHQGMELQATARLTPELSASGNLSLARHRFVDHEIFAYWLDDYAGGLLRYDGNTIPRSPEALGNVSLDWSRGAASTGLDLRYVGQQYVDGENREELAIDPHARVDLRASFDVAQALGSGRALDLQIRVLNVFDTLYETFGYSYYDEFPPTPVAFYWPGATRSVFVSLRTVL